MGLGGALFGAQMPETQAACIFPNVRILNNKFTSYVSFIGRNVTSRAKFSLSAVVTNINFLITYYRRATQGLKRGYNMSLAVVHTFNPSA